MTDKMLKFVNIGQQTPPKRDVGNRKEDFNEIYDDFIMQKAQEQSSRCSQCGVPFCQVHCPLSNNIPDWLKLTAEGRLKEAYELSQSTNNMPEVCGRICPQDRLCEGNCVIEQSGHGTVTIGSVEKYITDNAWEKGWVNPINVKKEKDQSVGIIGAGPAGLAAAEQLRKNGYKITVYDRYDRAGGLLIYGIPNFKLEKHVVERRTKLLKDGGIEFVQNFIEILILSAIQGISEFLPISSSAHLIIVSNLYDLKASSLLIDISLHLGSLIAIIFFFRKDLFNLRNNQKLLSLILIGSIPLIIFGYILHTTELIHLLRNIKVIAWTTLFFGIILYFADQRKINQNISTNLDIKSIIFIGLFQILALIPGVSRAGITMTAARFLNFNRVDAGKISFLLSIPALAGASFLGLNDISNESIEISTLVLTAIISSFLFSYFTVKFFLKYLNNFSLNIFVIYRIIIALILFLIIYF